MVAHDPLPVAPSADSITVHVHEETESRESTIADLRYEVMYFLDAEDDKMHAFREVWAGIGDSIVIVGGDGLYNCHIHTDNIGAAVEAALDAGRPRNIRVTDLTEQVIEERWVREGSATQHDVELDAAPTTSVVAVVVGDGVGRIFRSLGVRVLVAGGQSMNPSTADLVAAVEATGSRPGRAPAEQQEHPTGRRAGERPRRADRHRRADELDRRGLRGAARVRPRRHGRAERHRDERRRPATSSPAR